MTDLHDYAKIVKDIRPSVVVLPDVINNREDTQHRAAEYTQRATWEPKHYMFVPQGEGIADTLQAYDDAFRQLDPGRYIIGIGKSYYHWCAGETERAYEVGRVQMVEDIFGIPDSQLFRFHLLGGRTNPTQRFSSWTGSIVGLDAYDPCGCTLQDTIYPNFDPKRRVNHLSDAEGPGGDEALKRNVSTFCNYYGLTMGTNPIDKTNGPDDKVYI